MLSYVVMIKRRQSIGDTVSTGLPMLCFVMLSAAFSYVIEYHVIYILLYVSIVHVECHNICTGKSNLPNWHTCLGLASLSTPQTKLIGLRRANTEVFIVVV
jgi:hypothetical protein